LKVNKVIVRVKGGLGNQLFIYSFARSISLKYNIKVYLEIRSGFVKDPYKRKYLLKHFDIKLRASSWLDSLYYPLNIRFNKLIRFLYGNTIYCTEHNLDIGSIDILLNSPTKIYLDGYWQKEEYFEEYKDIIRNEFNTKFQISQKYKDVSNEMKSCNSVALHVRRVQYKDVLGPDYYKNAIVQIKTQVDNPVFYIFSDDLGWCKEKLKLNEKLIFINHNTNDEISDLWLMSQCKHFITANSTFSWWGATLSSNKQKVIIAPLK
jgi:hypothetical protein